MASPMNSPKVLKMSPLAVTVEYARSSRRPRRVMTLPRIEPTRAPTAAATMTTMTTRA